MIPPPALIAQVIEFGRCPCPRCKALDKRFPTEGYQLALFAYRIQTKVMPR